MTQEEKKIFNYGILVGTLQTISRFNDKTNQGYDFSLSILPKQENITKSVESFVVDISESYELKEIETGNAFKFFSDLLHDKWFYEYQNINEIHLPDPGKHFSLYDEDWKREWIEEFVNFLLETINPINIYEIIYQNLLSYYASDFDDFILENKDEIYYFKLSVSD